MAIAAPAAQAAPVELIAIGSLSGSAEHSSSTGYALESIAGVLLSRRQARHSLPAAVLLVADSIIGFRRHLEGDCLTRIAITCAAGRMGRRLKEACCNAPA